MQVDQPRVALVTGGAQGIGKGIARRLLEQGWRVVIADVDDEAGRETIDEYGKNGEIRFVHTDMSNEDSVRQCVAQVIVAYGRLDALINNAGIADPASGPVEQLSLERWNTVIGTNLTGYFLAAKHAVPHLRQAHGAIVNIASTRALQSDPHSEAYAASKGGVVALTHALAISLEPDIRVNCISPGWIDTTPWKKREERRPSELRPIDHQQHPVGRVGTPDDIAGVVAFLLSDAADFITGQNLVVDGGMTRKLIYVE